MTEVKETPTAELDFDARYTVDGWGGVAWYLEGYAKEYPSEDSRYSRICEDEECDHETELCYIYDDDPEPIENKERVIAVMVGDDREVEFGIDELTKLDENQYCPGCGQIGPPCAGWEM